MMWPPRLPRSSTGNCYRQGSRKNKSIEYCSRNGADVGLCAALLEFNLIVWDAFDNDARIHHCRQNLQKPFPATAIIHIGFGKYGTRIKNPDNFFRRGSSGRSRPREKCAGKNAGLAQQAPKILHVLVATHAVVPGGAGE